MSASADRQPQPRGPGLGCWVAPALVLLAGLALFVWFPLHLVLAPAWLPPLQAATREALNQAGPALLVAVLATIIGLAEITSTFPNYPREALRTRWAWVLVLVNLLAALLALWVVREYSPDATNPLLLAMGVGLGFPALIRTKFILAKQIGPGGQGQEVSVNLGWLYDQFQNLCKTQIDLDLMNGRRAAVTKLLRGYPTVQELHGIAAYTIDARETLTDEEEKLRVDALTKLVGGQAPTEFARRKLALFILETGGQAYVNYLLDEFEGARPGGPRPGAPESGAAQPPAAAPQLSPMDAAVKQLGEKYSLADLVKLANDLFTDKALRDWVKQTAESAPGVTEDQQKTAISYRLVREIGPEAAKKLLET